MTTGKLLLALALGGTFLQAAPDYFPLQPGNQWVYRATGRLGSPLTITVGEPTKNDGPVFYPVTGLVSGPAMLRLTEDGKLVQSQNGFSDAVLADFSAPEGTGSPSAMMPGCGQTATLRSRAAHYEGQLGVFDTAVEITYSPGICADAGLLRDVYLPYVGLVQRVSQTIAGPVQYDLIYARLGGVTEIAEPSVLFAVSADRPVLAAGTGVLNVRLNLRNSAATPLRLEFPSSQDFDVELSDEAGNRVYTWSAGKAFAQVYRQLDFSGENNWLVAIPTAGLGAGRYTVQGYLATAGPQPKRYAASVGIEIR